MRLLLQVLHYRENTYIRMYVIPYCKRKCSQCRSPDASVLKKKRLEISLLQSGRGEFYDELTEGYQNVMTDGVAL